MPELPTTRSDKPDLRRDIATDPMLHREGLGAAKPSDCHHCGAPGRVCGLWRSPCRGREWVVFQCRECLYCFESAIDGQERAVRISWMVPKKDSGIWVMKNQRR